jgi:hypothetical protein
MLTKNAIIKKYVKLVLMLSRYPTRVELQNVGVSRDILRHHFGNMTELLNAAKEEMPDAFESLFTSEDFTKSRLKDTKAELREATEFIITTAVAGCGVFTDALASLDTWSKKTGGVVVLQPIADPARPREKNAHMFFDASLKDYNFVWEDVKLNSKVTISSILQSAKQLNPHTGLNRIVDNKGLTIIASPKRRLTPMGNMSGQPGYLMSGGAITIPDYVTDMYMSERTARFGEAEHVFGGVYVKIVGQNRYEFTNITFDKVTGEFCHNGQCYRADGTIEAAKVQYIGFGDLHVEEMLQSAYDSIKAVLENEKPVEVDIQDVFSGISCSPFNIGKPELMYLESEENSTSTVLEDLEHVAEMLTDLFDGSYIKHVNIVDSNHHHFLESWITSGKYRKGDHRNILFAHKLATQWLEQPALPILQSAMLLLASNRRLAKKFEFYTGIDSLTYSGVERLQHGHVDGTGKRNPPLDRLLVELGPCNVGHAHCSEIIGEAFRVGTMCPIGAARPAYARKGPSKWSQSYVRGYENGQRQLVHIIK